MKLDKIEKRTLAAATYMVYTKDTLRSTAEIFGIGKSTLYRNITKVLKTLDFNLYKQVQEVLTSRH